jgi:hypothetical protein
MGGKKLMTSMAAASQLATTPSTSSQFSADALPLPPISVIPNDDPASVSNSDHSDDSEYNTEEGNPEDHESDDDSGDSRWSMQRVNKHLVRESICKAHLFPCENNTEEENPEDHENDDDAGV